MAGVLGLFGTVRETGNALRLLPSLASARSQRLRAAEANCVDAVRDGILRTKRTSGRMEARVDQEQDFSYTIKQHTRHPRRCYGSESGQRAVCRPQTNDTTDAEPNSTLTQGCGPLVILQAFRLTAAGPGPCMLERATAGQMRSSGAEQARGLGSL